MSTSSTHPTANAAVRSPSIPAKRSFHKDFYFIMSLVIAGVVVFGFSHTVSDRLIHPSSVPPWILYLHAALFSGWVLFFILQTALVRTRNVAIHRKLGWFGVVMGCAIPIVGVTTAVIMDRFHNATQQTHDAGHFAIVSFTDMLCFAVPFFLAVSWRKRPDYHRRLMFIASCALTAAAFGRIPFFDQTLTFYVGVDALVLLGVLRDFIADGKINVTYRYALPAMIAVQVFAVYCVLTLPPYWQAAARVIAP